MDTIDLIMKFEAGELDDESTIKLFQALIDDDSVWELQGVYGRMAHELIQNGLCFERSAKK